MCIRDRLKVARGGIRGLFERSGSERRDGISISLLGTTHQTSTTADGTYQLTGIPVGEYKMQACVQGYEPYKSDVAVREGQVVELPNDGEVVILPRQQIRLAAGGTSASTQYTLRFEERPPWVTAVKLSGDLNNGGTDGFIPFDSESGNIEIELSNGEGQKRVEIQLKGEGCLISDPLQTVITLDQRGPSLAGVTLSQPSPTQNTMMTRHHRVLCG